MEWISVKDRLPDPKDDVDVLVYYDSEYNEFEMAVAYWTGRQWVSELEDPILLSDVTHWMPLPKPPEEG
jgi:hypothetical protein